MDFQSSVIELMKKRTSWRTYEDKNIPDSLIHKLENYIHSIKSGLFGTELRFEFIRAPEQKKEQKIKLGTYGFIKGAKYFIASACKNSKMNIEDIGYTFQKILLFCTDLGLGTCWIGASFNSARFSEQINLKKNELLPAISPVGYNKQKRSIRSSIVRGIVGAKNRKPFENLFFFKNFETSLSEELAGSYSEVLEMVRLGPSASNKQPWRIVKNEDGGFHFYLYRSQFYSNATKKMGIVDVQRLDMGICMCNFNLAAKELKLDGKFEITNPGIEAVPKNIEYCFSWTDKS